MWLIQNGIPIEVIRCRPTNRTVIPIVEDAAGTLVCSHFNEIIPKTSVIGDANIINANSHTAEAAQTCVGQQTAGNAVTKSARQPSGASDDATLASAPANVTSSDPGRTCRNRSMPDGAIRAMISPNVTMRAVLCDKL